MQSNLPAARDPEDNEIIEEPLSVELFATADLPTHSGPFRIVAFTNNRDEKEHVALIHGDIRNKKGILTRIHSECLTGDVFGSLKCDCGDQLELAMQEIADGEAGIILYMRQEGRGIGLANKVKAYSLQDTGLDTVEANQHLGFDNDLRDYQISAQMLDLLGVESIVLMTNNPAKVQGLSEAGVVIDKRREIKTIPNPHNFNYLETKRLKSGHLL